VGIVDSLDFCSACCFHRYRHIYAVLSSQGKIGSSGRIIAIGVVNIVDKKTMKAHRFVITAGALKEDDIGDSGDNKDSEDLFFDDEGI
jgi:hypothetical protein